MNRSNTTDRIVDGVVKWPGIGRMIVFQEDTGEFSSNSVLTELEFDVENETTDYSPREMKMERRLFPELWFVETGKTLFQYYGGQEEHLICAFLLDNCFPSSIWSIEYCLCDPSGRRIDSRRYKVDTPAFRHENKLILSAFLSEKQAFEEVDLCILRVNYHSLGKLFDSFSVSGFFTCRSMLPGEESVCLAYRKVIGLNGNGIISIPDSIKELKDRFICATGLKNAPISFSQLPPLTEEHVEELVKRKIYSGCAFEHLTKEIANNALRNEPQPHAVKLLDPKQALLYYSRQYFPDAIEKKRIKNMQADVLIPSISVAIVYDDFESHYAKYDADIRKNNTFSAAGYFTIRIREKGLPPLPPFNGVCVDTDPESVVEDAQVQYIADVLHLLAAHVADTELASRLSSFMITIAQFANVFIDTEAKQFDTPVAYNVKLSCMYKYWDSEKNARLIPENIPRKSDARAWYTCPDGESQFLRVYCSRDILWCDRNCKRCLLGLCPLIGVCDRDCSHLRNVFQEYMNGEYVLPADYHDFNKFAGRSKITLDYLQQLIEGKLDEERKKRLERLFIQTYGPNSVSKITFTAKFDNQIELLKRLMDIYPIMFYIRVTPYDNNDESRKQITDYYRWSIQHMRVRAFELASHIFYVRNSPRINKMLIDMLNEEEISSFFEKNGDSIKSIIDQYVEKKKLRIE